MTEGSSKFLSANFLSKYEGKSPKNKGILFEVIYLRTYSRWLPERKRRETWQETVERVVEYNISLYQGPAKKEDLIKEAELMYDKVFNLEVLPAGRSLWIGGTEASQKYSESNFNCSALVIKKLEDFCDIFHLLMCGCGVGYRILKEDVAKLPSLNWNFNIVHEDYLPVHPAQRLEDTIYQKENNSTIRITVGDSKKAWVDALRYFLHTLESSKGGQVDILFNYNSVRPSGERIKTFGGRAAGPSGLQDMFSCIERVVKEKEGILNPVACMDIANMIAKNVLVGGTRRSAQIALGSPDDEEFITAKRNLYTKVDGKWIKDSSKEHRTMSNNSVTFTSKPSLEEIKNIFSNIKNNGEPGFFNLEAALERRPNANTANPCLTKEAWISTSSGPKQIKDLIGTPFKAQLGSDSYNSKGFFKTGFKEIFVLDTEEGFRLNLTSNHKMLTKDGWKEAKDLVKGDYLVIDKGVGDWSGIGSFDQGWILGNLIGDGCFSRSARENSSDLGILRYWGPLKEQLADGALAIVTKEVVHRSDLKVVPNKINKYNQIACTGIAKLASNFNITPDNKACTPELENTSSNFHKGFLRGIFDADGSPQGSLEKGYSVRLSQVNKETLSACQRMLLRLGIKSTIYWNRSESGLKPLPDGKGGKKEYFCQSISELIISREDIIKFHNLVGFSDTDKSKRLDGMVNSYTRIPYKSSSYVRFKSLEFIGFDDVYDCTVEEVHRFNANGLVAHNCLEILLDDYGVCNLSTVILSSHIENGVLDLSKLTESLQLATRIGMRQTNVSLSLSHWNEVQKRDRLTGVSITGFMDAMDSLGISFYGSKELLESMNEIANQEARDYAFEMRIPTPLLVTAIKPEGTLSLLPTVSPGLHRSYAPYYIRRVRVSQLDPVCKALQSLGVPNEPDATKSSSGRIVFSFPINSGAKIAANDESAIDQFNRYLMMQKYYTDHNSSCTLTVGGSEWEEILQAVYDNWNDVVACAFLPKDDMSYPQMPLEAITKEQYMEMISTFPNLSNLAAIVNKFELEEAEEDELVDEACSTGSCPIR